MSQKDEQKDEQKASENSPSFDSILFMGEISRKGYLQITDLIKKSQKSNQVKMYLCTYGGDPDAAFRITRALKHHYEYLTLYVASDCKSAGTLIAIGADEIVISDRGELGPLDVQYNKPDEFFELTSGLNIAHAVNYLTDKANQNFASTLIGLKTHGGIGTKLAAEISANLTHGLFSPMLALFDPNRIGEVQRSMSIALEYGNRLNEKCDNLQEEALPQLIASYPSHGFVIDRKEARTLFKRVRAPDESEIFTCEYAHKAWQEFPKNSLHIEILDSQMQEKCDEQINDTRDASASTQASIRPNQRTKKSAARSGQKEPRADESTVPKGDS